MMNALANLSNIIIPALIFYIVAYGVIHHTNVYEDFIKGAEDGFKTVIQIMPTLIGLMMAVGILRASGFLEFFRRADREAYGADGAACSCCAADFLSNCFPLRLQRDWCWIFLKNYGTDSYIGMMTSILMSCTETCFYTMSVYFMAAKVTKTRYTLAGALTATAAGIIASIVLAGII